MDINESVKNKSSDTVPEELLLQDKFETEVKELIVNINKNEEEETFLLSSDDRIKDVNLIVRDSHHETHKVDLDIDDTTEDVNKINIIELVCKEGEQEEITKEVNKENNTETITVSVHDKVQEVNVVLSNNEHEIKEIKLELRNEGDNVNEIQLELTDVEKVDVTNVETVTFVENDGKKIIESVNSETEIKFVDSKNKSVNPKEIVQENGESCHEGSMEKTNLTNLENLKNIEEGKGVKVENTTNEENDKNISDSNKKAILSTSDDNKETKDTMNEELNNDLSLQSAKSLESKVVWEMVSETQKDVDVVDVVKDERKQETDLDDDDYFDRHNDVFLEDNHKESTSSYGDPHGEMWQEYNNKLLSPIDNADVCNNGGREKSVFLSFLEDRQKQKALSISDLNNKDTPLYDEATGRYASAQAPAIPPPPAAYPSSLVTTKQHTCGSLFGRCVSANHSDSLVQTFSKQRNQQVESTNTAKPFADDGYTGPVSLTEIIQEREQNAKYHPDFNYKKKYSPSTTTSDNYCNKTWSDWGVIGGGTNKYVKKPENIRMCKFEEIDEEKLDKRLLMGNGASTPVQFKNRNTNGLCENQSGNVGVIDSFPNVSNHLEYVNGVVPVLKRELREWELKATDLNSEVVVLRREVKRKEQEIFRLQREVHKLKSVLQQATSFSQDGSPDLLSSLQEKHGMAGQINGTNNKKQGVSAESSQPNKTATDIQIEKYEKDFRSKQLIKDAIMDNDFLKNLDLSQVREIVESMYPKECAKGSYLIREGEAGAHLYVSAEGEFEVIKHNKVLGHMGSGKAFGELAILYNCTRTASIRVVNDSKVWVLDRRIFQRIMMRTGLQRLEDNVNFLRSVPLLRNLSVDILAKISDALQVEFYPTGHHIIRQGANGDSFFILSQGSVKVTQRLPGSNEEQELRILERGDYFGEQALLNEECRTASVIALPPGVECLTLDRESFTQLIGELSELQEKEYSDLPRPPSVVSVHEQSSGDQELDNIRLDDLDVIATLGVGGFGRVELVQCLHEKSRTFALKCMKKQHIVETHQQEHVYSEKDIMISCRHPFICRLYKTFKDTKYVYMLLDACLGGEVWTILRDRGCFDDATACFITACVVEALDYLHSRGIVFRDLKPENLLLDSQGYVKLVDFGFAKRLGYHSSKTWTFCGTPEYVAPEIILNKGHDRAVDIWALGILMHELLTGAPPFSGTDMKVYNMILKGIDMIDFPRHVTKTAQALIKRLCRESPSERLGCQKGGLADIKKHKWFQGFDWEGLRQRTLVPPILPQVRGCTDTSNFDQYAKDNNIPPDEHSNWDEDF